MKISFYSPELVEKLHQFEEKTVSKIFKSIELLKVFGNTLRMPHSKKITTNLFELGAVNINKVVV